MVIESQVKATLITILIGVCFIAGMLSIEYLSETKDLKKPPKYFHSQFVELDLNGFYKNCDRVGKVVGYNGYGDYEVRGILCPKEAGVQDILTLTVSEETIIRVLEEKK